MSDDQTPTCAYCQQAAATNLTARGHGVIPYRSVNACRMCLPTARRWVKQAGAVTETPIADVPPDPQAALF